MKNTPGHFGIYGGRFAPEVLLPALQETENAWMKAKRDKKFWEEFDHYAKTYVGRPSPLTFAENLTKMLKGAKIYVKREDLNHTGAHKINNALGQALLTKRMGKKRVITETGAGQNGVAVATVSALFGFECTIYMGEEDIERQRPNVFWMERLGANVMPVATGTRTLKDATNEALRDWITNVGDTHYMIGSALGPHPFPEMVREFQRIIGKEARRQILSAEGRLPDAIIACVGGGSNAIGIFTDFLKNKKVRLIGVEAGGVGLKGTGHASRFSGKGGKIGIMQGYKSIFLQTDDGQIAETHSISAGLDYPGIGPEHAHLHDLKRVEYTSASDKEVISAFLKVIRNEGMVPALESAHAWAEAIRLAPKLGKGKIIIVNQSGRGDKDIFLIADALEDKKWKAFLRKKGK